MDESAMTDDQLLAQRCKLCGFGFTECGCVLSKSPAVHAALARRFPGYQNPVRNVDDNPHEHTFAQCTNRLDACTRPGCGMFRARAELT